MKRQRSGHRGGALLAALLGCVVVPAAAQQSDAAIGVSSSLVTRGIVLGRREPSLQASAAYYATNGLYAGISAATLRLPSEQHHAVQVAAKGGLLLPLRSDWTATLSLQHFAYPFDPSWEGFGYDEASAGLAYGDVAAMSVSFLRHAGDYAAGSRSSMAADLVGRYPLRPGLALAAGIGWHDLHRRYGFGYGYGHAGVALRVGRASLDLAYTFTDATARERFGPNADNRWTASVMWHF
jgi:uncharacterized protein (TIGR02001 family)